MPYALKLTRNTDTQIIKVHRITRAPEGAKPYKHWLHNHYVESLQIFEDREAAELARTHELLAAEFARLNRDELYEIFRKDLDRVAFFGWNLTCLCEKSGLNYTTMTAYRYKTWTPNPRVFAKVHLIADALENVAKIARDALPADAGCGNPLDNRRGRKDIYKSSPYWKG